MEELLRAEAGLEILISIWKQHLEVPTMKVGAEDELDRCDGPKCAWCKAYTIFNNRIHALEGFIERIEK